MWVAGEVKRNAKTGVALLLVLELGCEMLPQSLSLSLLLLLLLLLLRVLVGCYVLLGKSEAAERKGKENDAYSRA